VITSWSFVFNYYNDAWSKKHKILNRSFVMKFKQGNLRIRKLYAKSLTKFIWMEVKKESSIGSPVGSFGHSTFSRVFFQGATTPPLRQLQPYIAVVQFGKLPPYSLVQCRRIVWCIAAVRFGSISSSATSAPLVTDLTQSDG